MESQKELTKKNKESPPRKEEFIYEILGEILNKQMEEILKEALENFLI